MKNIDKRVEKDMNISDAKLQAELLLSYSRKWFLTQKVNEATREGNILDMIFDNDDIVQSIEMLENDKISDHKTLIVDMIFNIDNKEEEEKKNFCFMSIPEYDIKGANSKMWDQALNWDYDWSNITAEKLLKIWKIWLKMYSIRRYLIKEKLKINSSEVKT